MHGQSEETIETRGTDSLGLSFSKMRPTYASVPLRAAGRPPLPLSPPAPTELRTLSSAATTTSPDRLPKT